MQQLNAFSSYVSILKKGSIVYCEIVRLNDNNSSNNTND